MIVAKNLDELTGSIGGACATIGNFDGVHMGHRRLITRVNDRAQAKNLIGMVVTFDPHPLTVVGSARAAPGHGFALQQKNGRPGTRRLCPGIPGPGT